MNIAPAAPVLLTTPGSGIAPGPMDGHGAGFAAFLEVMPPMAPLPLPPPLTVPPLDGAAAPPTILVTDIANLPPLARGKREPASALPTIATRSDTLRQAPATGATTVMHEAPGRVQSLDPVLTAAVTLEAAAALPDPDRPMDPVLPTPVASKGVPRPEVPSAPAASRHPDPQRPAPEDEDVEAGLPATAAVIALPASVLPTMPLPVIMPGPPSAPLPGIEPAPAAAVPADMPPAGAMPLRSDMRLQQRSGIALVAAGRVQSLSGGTLTDAKSVGSLFDALRTAAPAPVSADTASPDALAPEARTLVPLPRSDSSSDVAAAAIDTARAVAPPPVAAVAVGRNTPPAAAIVPYSHPPATASAIDRRGRPLLRDTTDVLAPAAGSPGDIGPGLVLARDSAPTAATPRDAASPVKTMAELPTETAVLTERFGTVQIAVEGTASDVKVSLALAPMAVLAPADAQRLASGLAADLAATGVRLQSLDISGGDSGRGGAPQGQRDPNPQPPTPPALSSQRSPPLPLSDRYA